MKAQTNNVEEVKESKSTDDTLTVATQKEQHTIAIVKAELEDLGTKRTSLLAELDKSKAAEMFGT